MFMPQLTVSRLEVSLGLNVDGICMFTRCDGTLASEFQNETSLTQYAHFHGAWVHLQQAEGNSGGVVVNHNSSPPLPSPTTGKLTN